MIKAISKNTSVHEIIKNLRSNLGLENKTYSCNIYYLSQRMEDLHILKKAINDICREYHIKYEQPLREENNYPNK